MKLVVLLAAALALGAQGEPAAVFRIEFTNAALSPASWSLTVRPDGTGHFHAERGAAATAGAMEPEVIDRDVQLSPEYARSVFEKVRRHGPLRDGQCESRAKVAFQGVKKLSYTGPEGSSGCAFNYAKDKEIQALSDSLQAVATTLIEGARVELLLQHEPLGLDRALAEMQAGVRDGRLQQVGAIRPLLERLQTDDAVMDRVRRRAQALLADASK